MKRNFKIMIFFLLTISIMACKKNDPNDIPIKPLAALTITNVISQGKFVRLNSNVIDSCALNNYKIFTIVAGNPSPIKAFASSAPNTPYYHQSLNIAQGGIYSLYLTGTNATAEAVFVKDDIPPYPSDDVVNVRLVNLSPNAGVINVTLASTPNVNLFTNVAYKQVTDFITLPLPAVIPSGTNVFQFRNATGTVLFTYTLPTTGTISIASSRHRNITLALKGILGGSGTDVLGVIGVPHY